MQIQLNPWSLGDKWQKNYVSRREVESNTQCCPLTYTCNSPQHTCKHIHICTQTCHTYTQSKLWCRHKTRHLNKQKGTRSPSAHFDRHKLQVEWFTILHGLSKETIQTCKALPIFRAKYMDMYVWKYNKAYCFAYLTNLMLTLKINKKIQNPSQEW